MSDSKKTNTKRPAPGGYATELDGFKATGSGVEQVGVYNPGRADGPDQPEDGSNQYVPVLTAPPAEIDKGASDQSGRSAAIKKAHAAHDDIEPPSIEETHRRLGDHLRFPANPQTK